ncbi:MAG TPA: hypothetical protein VHF89_04810, partial [Solirubrobacteraceae bacterium]|nr:hypothetical protein [Solirubrobacteraceae bacterium]
LAAAGRPRGGERALLAAAGRPRGGGRALLAAAGLVLAGSLFLPWFEGVSGWEHFAWADVALLVVAVALPVAPRPVVAVLCGLGIAVVLGHGLEPDELVILHVGEGPYVALGALAAGAIAGLARWPAVLLVAAACGLVAALLSGWGRDWEAFEPSGALDAISYPNGFERWRFLDVGLLLLAAGLLLAATRRAPVALRALLAAASVAAAACVIVAGRTQLWHDEGLAEGAAMGTLAALLALAGAVAGLALVSRPREREPAARDG